MDFFYLALTYIGIGAGLFLVRLPFVLALELKGNWIFRALSVVAWPVLVVSAVVYAGIAAYYIQESVGKDAFYKWVNERIERKKAKLS